MTGNKVFLDADPEIRGQRFACLSFVSPEDIVLSRQLFTAHKFLGTLGAEVKDLFDHLSVINPTESAMISALQEKYAYLDKPDELKAFYNIYCAENAEHLDKEFAEQCGGLTSVRALKIRGVYDTVEEARERAKELRDKDKGLFNVYVAQVGCWLTWSPNPDEITDSVYADSQLNLLMDKYRENSKMRDLLYADRKNKFTSNTQVATDQVFESGPIVTESGKVLH